MKYVCGLCGYVYDEESSPLELVLPEGTSFLDLPDDWVCPLCGAGREEFEQA